MNPTRVAKALDQIAEGVAALSLAVLDDETAKEKPLTTSTTWHESEDQMFDDTFDESQLVSTKPQTPVQAVVAEQLAEACPKHGVEYRSGQYGPFCAQKTDDPGWGRKRGDDLWCTITPKTAAKWLQQYQQRAAS